MSAKKTVKIPWEEFVSYAMAEVGKSFRPTETPPSFMIKSHGYDSDHECCETPDYVEIEIE